MAHNCMHGLYKLHKSVLMLFISSYDAISSMWTIINIGNRMHLSAINRGDYNSQPLANIHTKLAMADQSRECSAI